MEQLSNKRRVIWGTVCAALACLVAIYVLPLQAAPQPDMMAVIQAHPPITEFVQPETAVLPHSQIADDTACRLCHQDTEIGRASCRERV